MPGKYDPMFPERYRRQAQRMPNHNYAWSGIYFVTIRAKRREPIFEDPTLREILQTTWEALPLRFMGATLDEFVIMPDHVHFILWLEGNVEKPAQLGDVVGTYKSLTTVAWLRHIKSNGIECPGIIWQRNYFDRCIRDQNHLEQTRFYIRNNPDKLLDQ